ncbi:v-myb avian myeloblastosis viral oncogene homolog-like 2a isoform X2 [Eucyclogobius newberryi]|uniref:v-myb avian myeloblastosis viral oncogene homolog-like 2a isoform X2 n=1 Tax=Eucyclogobius newberryi TaxID=166745 RepID=UPI003B5A4B1E
MEQDAENHAAQESDSDSDKKVKWTPEEDEDLKLLVGKYGQKDWKTISSFFPGRSEAHCMNRWSRSVNPVLVKGYWTEEEDQQVEFKSDVVLDTEPITPKFQNDEQQQPQKAKEKLVVHPATSKSPLSARGPSSSPSSSSRPSPSTSPGSAPSAAVDQKKLEEAALRMIAEDMLPLSFVEGTGFRSFMSTMCPQHSRLSQRAVGLRLYGDVERTYKPQLIRDLKACLAQCQDGECVIHASVDLWAGSGAAALDEPMAVVQLHFISETWQLRRPIVAFRHLRQQDLSASLSRELEGVLLSYGIFPQRIGYVLTNNAKHALATNSLFCDYKLILNRAEAEGEELVSFLTDQLSEEDSPVCRLQMGSGLSCVGQMLQQVIKEALRDLPEVEDLLSQVQNVVAFFRSKACWSEVLMKQCGALLWPPPSSCRWNSMLMSLRRMVQESTWNSMMSVLAQARTEAHSSTSVPPLVSIKREQVRDILRLLEPFEVALQALQGNGVSISSVIPSLIQLDKALCSSESSSSGFSRALRTGLRTHAQSLLHHTDLLMATVLDPRLRLKPFGETTEEQTDFISPPSKSQVVTMIEAALCSLPSSVSLLEEKGESRSPAPESQETTQAPPIKTSDDVNIENGLKRKSARSLPEPPDKCLKVSELEAYLSEAPSTGSSCVSFWKSAQRFPGLQRCVRRLLPVPVTSGGFDRLYPTSMCLIRAKRNRLPAHTTERLLLYKDSMKSSVMKKPKV